MSAKRPSPPSCLKIAQHWKAGGRKAPIRELPRVAHLRAQDLADTCWACGLEALVKWCAVPERSHIVAHSRGGSNEPGNFLLLCKVCHGELPDALPKNAQLAWCRMRTHVDEKFSAHIDRMMSLLDSFGDRDSVGEALGRVGGHEAVRREAARIRVESANTTPRDRLADLEIALVSVWLNRSELEKQHDASALREALIDRAASLYIPPNKLADIMRGGEERCPDVAALREWRRLHEWACGLARRCAAASDDDLPSMADEIFGGSVAAVSSVVRDAQMPERLTLLASYSNSIRLFFGFDTPSWRSLAAARERARARPLPSMAPTPAALDAAAVPAA